MIFYQCNCRGIKNKSAELQLHIESHGQKPDVIALQETRGRPRIPGYVTYADPSEEGTAVLARSNVAGTQHLTAQKGCEHTLVDIHARTIGSGGNLFVMSAYCRPLGVAARRGTGTNRDTVPNLSWLARTPDATWRNEDVSLGSDHDILSVTTREPKSRAEIGTARITDLDRMRKCGAEAAESSAEA
ncbi:hypothetical protein HPB48_023551 [Haemaphysalis longicornis]|uniref:Endonuclease/exonuclease/phosphatase domain-containing protein n=1 Tax=Haemaphysalis longicornis TaxID=44386 RepID=A0A9J6H756_HAELO|nr:hypothetical protein HPB48_023551 [Haemaphysalis longicornis]